MTTLHVFSNRHIKTKVKNIEDGDYVYLENRLSRKRWSLYFKAASINEPAVNYITEEELFAMTKNFDNIIGNPPFSISDKESNGTRGKQLYTDFVLKSMELSDNVSMIMPSLWTHKKSTLKKKLFDFGLVSITECSSDFPDIELDTCRIVAQRHYGGELTIQPSTGPSYKIEEWTGKEIIHLNVNVTSKNIMTKLKNDSNLDEIWARSDTNRNDKTIGNGNNKIVEITGSESEEIVLLTTTKNKEEFPGFDSWKVITNNVGRTNRTIGVIKTVPPGIGATYSVICLLVSNEEEAYNLKRYLESKVVTFIVKNVKNSGVNSKSMFSNIPFIDLSILWSDEMLYKHFKLSKKEISIIESF